jgi:hypothetical protein
MIVGHRSLIPWTPLTRLVDPSSPFAIAAREGMLDPRPGRAFRINFQHIPYALTTNVASQGDPEDQR